MIKKTDKVVGEGFPNYQHQYHLHILIIKILIIKKIPIIKKKFGLGRVQFNICAPKVPLLTTVFKDLISHKYPTSNQLTDLIVSLMSHSDKGCNKDKETFTF